MSYNFMFHSLLEPDPYEWCVERKIYISQDDLLERLQRKDGKTLICDVRDDDVFGGHITGICYSRAAFVAYLSPLCRLLYPV